MIDLTVELAPFAAKVVGIDPRVGEATLKARPVFDKGIGTNAGECCGVVLRVHPAQNDDEQRETLGHEYAHLLDHTIFGGSGHAYGWAYWMRKLGLPPEKYHNSEGVMRASGRPVYAVLCHDCGQKFVRLYEPRRCQDPECGSPDVRTFRADGFSA